MKEVLKTSRLYLREMSVEDLGFLTALHQDPEVMRYLGPLKSARQVADRLDSIIKNYMLHPGLGIWMACHKEDHLPVGWACLKDLDRTPNIEIGYRLAQKHWGKGYATELARALVDYGFDQMELNEICGVCHPENKGSASVLKKAGLLYRSIATYYKVEVMFFSLKKGLRFGT